MVLFLNIFTVLLLALVAGLLMMLWGQLRFWRLSVKQSPLLAENLAEQLISARKGMEDIRRTLVEHGPELSSLLSEAQKRCTELEFLVQKSEQAAAKMDKVAAMKVTRNIATVEEVAGANGKAIQQTQKAHDPLEDLLVSLQDNEIKSSVPKLKKKSATPTQAELDLQRKIGEKK